MTLDAQRRQTARTEVSSDYAMQAFLSQRWLGRSTFGHTNGTRISPRSPRSTVAYQIVVRTGLPLPADRTVDTVAESALLSLNSA